MVRILVEGHEAVARTARGIFPLADKAADEPTADLLTQRLTVHETDCVDVAQPARRLRSSEQPAARMRIAILTFDGFNELDSFIALGLLNRLSADGWKAEIASPSTHVHVDERRDGAGAAAARVRERGRRGDLRQWHLQPRESRRIFGKRGAVLDRLQLDPLRQLIGAQCSGALLLARLGLLADMPACTDLTTKPWLIQAGVRVEDAPFHARGPIATAGGCLASAIPCGVDDGTRCRLRSGGASLALRRAGGRKGRVRGAAARCGAAFHPGRVHLTADR